MSELKPERLATVNTEYIEYLDKQLQSIQRHLTISRRLIKRLQPSTRKPENSKP